MRSFTVILATLVLAVAYVHSQPAPRIVGGTEATPHEFPWQVALSLRTSTGATYFCGGSLVSNNTVLTAAHCVDGIVSASVLLGAHDRLVSESEQVQITSTDLKGHESYRPNIIRNDIGRIILPQEVTFTSAIQAIDLPKEDKLPDPGIDALTSGWGRTGDAIVGDGLSATLRKAVAPTMDLTECQDFYSAVVTTQYNICLDTRNGDGTCNGDSGGPLIPFDSSTYGTALHGITSYGSSAGCESGYPSVFNRVSGYLDWIETNTGIKPPS